MRSEHNVAYITNRKRLGLGKKAPRLQLQRRPGLTEKETPQITYEAREEKIDAATNMRALKLLGVAVGVIGLAVWAQQKPETFRSYVQPALEWSARAALTIAETVGKHPTESVGILGTLAVGYIVFDGARKFRKRFYSNH